MGQAARLFFDLDSSASYLTDLLRDADPPFASIALTGEHAAVITERLRPEFAIVDDAEAKADVVVSWDVIHTLPIADRTAYVKRLATLAKRELIVACPLGTELQTAVYRSLANLCTETRQPMPEEVARAVKHGLPTPQDAANWAHGFPDLDLFYAGDVAFFQTRATDYLSRISLGPLRRLQHRLLKSPGPNFEPEAVLPPETVPMRRHRRMFLVIRKR